MMTTADTVRAMVERTVFDLCGALLRVCRARVAAIRAGVAGGEYEAFRRLRTALSDAIARHRDEEIDEDLRDELVAALSRWKLEEGLRARALVEAIDEHHGRAFGLTFRGVETTLGVGDAVPVARPPWKEILRDQLGSDPDRLTRRYDATAHVRLVPDLQGRGLVVDGRIDDALATFGRDPCVAGAIPNLALRDFEWDSYGDDEDDRRFFAVRPIDGQRQWRRIVALLDLAVRRGVQVLVYPELSFTEALLARFAAHVASAAASPPLVVAGSLHVTEASSVRRNRAHIFVRGRELAHHHKLVPFDLQEGDLTRREDIRGGETLRMFWCTAPWTVMVLICRDGLDTDIVTALEGLQVRMLLAPTLSPKTDTLAAHVERLAVDAQTLSVVANVPAGPRSYLAGTCLPLIVGLPRSSAPHQARLPDALPDKAFLGVARAGRDAAITYHPADD